MQYTVLLGRFFYSLIFIFAALGHFSQQTISYAASQGVPMAAILVPFSGVMALVGGLSILLGYKSRWGAVVIILFLIPVTIAMHNFWAVTDPMMKQIQMIMFLKNVSMLGTALMILYFGTGPLSLEKDKRE
jgi:putative oxidoreductase